MEKEVCFRVLGLEETRDEQKLKAAYLGLLKKTNPEDDPEGFKRLRLAYETALALARRPQPENGGSGRGNGGSGRENSGSQEERGGFGRESDDSGGERSGSGRENGGREPGANQEGGSGGYGDQGYGNPDLSPEIVTWMGRMEACVSKVTTRISEEAWSELLEDPVCEGLDTSLEVRERLLAFLMGHMYLPQQIWRLIDGCFQIVEDYKGLEETFPANYLNFIRYYVNNPGFIPYELFTIVHEGTENLDGYLEHYYGIKKKVDQGQLESCRQELDDLAAFGLYHPYEDVERIRIFLSEGEVFLAASLADKLKDLVEEGDITVKEAPYIWAFMGHARYKEGRREEAYFLWMEVLEEFPDYYQAKTGAVTYLVAEKRYWKARDLLLEMLEMDGRDDEILEQLKSVNLWLMERLRENPEYHEKGVEIPAGEGCIELGWCLFQNEMVSEAIEYLEGITPPEDQRYGYVNLLGRVLYQAGEYQKARPYLKDWLEMICETPADGTKENERRRSRKSRALNLLSGCCFELGDKEKAEEYIKKAADVAEDDQERLGSLQYLAHIMTKEGRYEQAVDICDQIIKEDENYYPAYLTRQEACYELRRGQDVVDDYHKAVEIYGGFYKPYLLAAQVFFYHDQYEDAKGVIEQAKENGAGFSDNMKLYEVKILRNLTDSNEERGRLAEMIKELKRGIAKETDIEDLSELEFELALLCWDGDLLSEALDHLNDAIRENGARPQYHMVRGDIYLSMKKYKEALTDFSEAELVYGGSPALHYNRAVCHEARGMKNLAIESYMEAVRLEDGYRDACEKLAVHYKELYLQQYKAGDYQLAVEYSSRQIAVRENPHTLTLRGLIYMSAMELDLAIVDFKKILQYDLKDWSAYNNLGCCYKYLGRFEEAVTYLENALTCMDGGKSHLPYGNMADCYEALGEYEKAIECYKKNLEDFPDRHEFWKEIGLLYSYMGEFKLAEQAYGHTTGMDDYYERIGDLWFLRGDIRKGVFFYRKWIAKADEKPGKESGVLFTFQKHLRGPDGDVRGGRYRELGTLYQFQMGDPGKAEACFRRAMECSRSPISLLECEVDLAWLYYLTDRGQMAKRHGVRAMELFERSGYVLEDYLGFRRYEAVRKGMFGRLYLALGEDEKGLALLSQMGEGHHCLHCRYKGCYERFLFLGQYYESRGLLSQAQAAYEEAKRLHPSSLIMARILENLQKKVDRQK